MTILENLLGRTLIPADDTWGLLGVMCLSVLLAICLEQKYKSAAKVTGSIIALLLAMIMGNLGVIPISCVLYDDIVRGVIGPMGIPLLLLQCNLKKIWREAGKLLTVFLIGAVGTVAGAFLAFYLLRAPYAASTKKYTAISRLSATVAAAATGVPFSPCCTAMAEKLTLPPM